MRVPRKPEPPVTKILIRVLPWPGFANGLHCAIAQTVGDGGIGFLQPRRDLQPRGHIEKGGSIRGGPGKIGCSLRRHGKPTLGGNSFDAFHQKRMRLPGGRKSWRPAERGPS